MITSKGKQRKMLKEKHECPVGGHQGVQRTYDRLKLYVTWPGMFQDVEDYTRSCEVRHKNKFTAHTLRLHSKKRILNIDHGINFI